MKILKKFLVGCLFSFLFVFSVNAEDITLSFDSYDVLDKFNETFPSWSDSNYVQSKAKEITERYASDYENVLMYYIPVELGKYSGGVLSYNGSTYNPGFVLYAWNGNKPFYYVKRSNRVYLVKDNSTTTTSFSKSDFDLMSIYGYTITDFSIDNTRSYSSSQLSSPNTIFQCDSVSDNKCNIRTYRLYSNAWNYLMPIAYYKFNTQDNFILPAMKSSDFENTNNFILPNGNVIGNSNPISFNDLMEDNYYNFGINNYNPQMYSIGDYDIALNDLYFNINKNEFLNNNANKKGRIEFATLEYVENFDLLENFSLYSDTEGIEVIVDTKNSYCEFNDGNTMRCVYDYKINGNFDGAGNFSLKMHNKNKNIFKNTLFLSSVKDTKISSFAQDTGYCTNYDNDYKRISTITNPKSVTFIREGNVRFPTDITKDSETLRGVFSFTWNEDFNYSESDFIVNFENNSKANLIGSYDFKCVGNSCFIDYHYASSSSTLEYANIKFIVTMPSEETKLIPKLNVNHCPNDSVVSITYNSNSTIDTIDSIIKKTFEDTGLDLSGLLNMPDLIDRGPIDSILTLPLNVLQTLTNTLSGSVCTPLTIKLPFVNKNMPIPCINTIYEEINATTFFEKVGSVASTIILINYFIFLYGWFERVIRMEPANIECWGFDNV